MKNKNKKIFFGTIAAVMLALFTCSASYAASTFPSTKTAASIIKKVDYHSLYTCYNLKFGGTKKDYKGKKNENGTDLYVDGVENWYQMDSEVETSVDFDTEYLGFSWRKVFPNTQAENAAYFPNGLTPAGGDSSNCAHVMNGKHVDGGDGWKESMYERAAGFKPGVELFEQTSNASTIEKFMTGLGYTKDTKSSGSDERKCIKIQYRPVRIGGSDYNGGYEMMPSTEETGTACFDIKDGKIATTRPDLDIIDGYSKARKYLRFDNYNSGQTLMLRIRYSNTEDGEDELKGCGGDTNSCAYSTPVGAGNSRDFAEQHSIEFYERDWGDFKSDLQKVIDEKLGQDDDSMIAVGCARYQGDSNDAKCEGGKYGIAIADAKIIEEDSSARNVVWKLNDRSTTAIEKAVKYLKGGSLSSQKVTDSELVLLYQYYILDVARGVVKCDLPSSEVKSEYKKVKWFDSPDKRSECYVTSWNVGHTYNVANSDKLSWEAKEFDDFIEVLNGISITKIADANKDDVDDVNSEKAKQNQSGETDPGNGEQASKDCYSKAGSLGWIICPIITTGAEMVQNTYEGMIVPFLRMNPVLFKQDSGTYQAWDVFRNIANIAFVAMFLVVIVSQLTGYGIDNYGIKKILPKLIAAAILINASYIICQLAVDICNIIGASIGDLFTKIGDTIMSSQPEICKSSCKAASAGGSGSWIALVAVVMAITAVSLLALGPQILIPVLLAIIAFVIAVFFLFVVLGIRQAVAVILVVASPLAFLCYMLPNTKKIFDKWLSMLKAVLIAYPICSAMVYGGDMVAKIILNTYGTSASNLASLTPILSAGIVAIAPIFLIPKVIKSSMGAIGNLSTRLQGGLSHRARGGANRRLQMSPLTQRQRYREKARMDRSQARMGEYNNRRAGRTLSRMNSRMDRNGQTVGDLSAAKRRQYMSAAGMVSAHDAEQQKAYAMSFENASPDSITASFNNMVSSGKYDKNLAHAAVQKLAEMNQHDKLNEMLGSMDSAYVGAMEVSDRAALGNQLASLKGSNVAAGLYGKRLAAGGSEGLSQYMRSAGGFNADIKNAGKNVIASQDDSALSYIRSSGGRFTNEQMAQSIGNLDTKQQAQVNGMWGAMSDKDKADTFASMSTEQYSKIDESLATAVGNGSLDTGRDIINANTDTQREALAGEEGKNLRAAQNTSQQSISDWSKASEKERKRVAKAAGLKDWSDLDSTTQSKFAYDNNIQRKAGETDEQLNARATSEWRRQSGFNADLAKAAQKAGYHNV